MANKLQHQGIALTVKPLGARRWRWEVSPPDCVVGMRADAGEVSGNESDAVRAAKAAIEGQTGLSRGGTAARPPA